ncbi:MAG TPA: 50S ribosomal protein L21 [Anaerolineaceae bacterium]|jgi:large subunit ribosomal protein L21|nr:50S ribosomal protein L21 [Anaerolineaceae bacterium]
MKYAIIEAGGKQYRAEEGRLVTVDLLPAEIGEKIVLDKVVLLVDGDSVTVGTPYIEGASVNTTVDDQIKGKKILVFKYKPRINYRKKTGHRQKYTRLLVDSIVME